MIQAQENPHGTKIRSIVAEQLGVDVSEVTPDASILDDLGADSLDVVELVMALEDAFDIEVPDEDVEDIRTIGDMERYVEERAAWLVRRMSSPSPAASDDNQTRSLQPPEAVTTLSASVFPRRASSAASNISINPVSPGARSRGPIRRPGPARRPADLRGSR